MNTVIGAFSDSNRAQEAMHELVDAGFPQHKVQVQSSSNSSSNDLAADKSRSDEENDGFMASVSHFFTNLFGGDTHKNAAGNYSEAVKRGHAVVVVDIDDEAQAHKAQMIMQDMGALDIDEQAAQWRQDGWAGNDLDERSASTGSMSADKPMANGMVNGMKSGDTQGQSVLNVVQEELKVGKRSVEQGGVRATQRVTEKPVSETVELREEQAIVQRKPVDRMATEADLTNFKEGVVEVRETMEQAVVGKTARVVEEVVVGKKVNNRTETVNDSVRRTDVDVERFEHATARGEGTDTGTGTGVNKRSNMTERMPDRSGSGSGSGSSDVNKNKPTGGAS